LKKKVSPLIWATASNTTGSLQMSIGVTGPSVGDTGLVPDWAPSGGIRAAGEFTFTQKVTLGGA